MFLFRILLPSISICCAFLSWACMEPLPVSTVISGSFGLNSGRLSSWQAKGGIMV